MRYTLVGASFFCALFWVTLTSALTIESLEASIDPSHSAWLHGLACRNYDRIVHLKININWSDKAIDVERSGSERLIFWDDHVKYLFPKGSYLLLSGAYIVNGYFIARFDGVHVGPKGLLMTSDLFEKTDAAKNPNLIEKKLRSDRCP